MSIFCVIIAPTKMLELHLCRSHFIRLIRGVVLRDVDVVDMSFDMSFDMFWLIAFSLIGIIVAAMRFKKTLD